MWTGKTSENEYGYEELKKIFEHEQRYGEVEEEVPLRLLDQRRRSRRAGRPRGRRSRSLRRSTAAA